ncbi:MAG: CCA tRNA nucleotidyltransferase [Eubacteriales bacterium]
MEMTTINLPDKVKRIIDILEEAGYQAYAVGGCVRDSILGRLPDDWDITTSATPEQVKKHFKKTIDTGIQHGTVTVMIQGEGFEVTTYRIDGEYEDSRHPKEVLFTPCLEEDLKRRDFTINAMAYNGKEIVDLFGGVEDLENGSIRCVGNPIERFGEDALRIMRGIRFSAQLGYEIEEETKRAISLLSPTLEHISAERIQVELVKLVTSPNPDYLRHAFQMGITKVVLAELDSMMDMPQNHPHHCYSVGNHALEAMKHVEADKVLRLAMLFHDVGKIETHTTDREGIDHFYGHARKSEMIVKSILKRLRFDNDTTAKVSKLALYHDMKIPLEEVAMRKAIRKVGEDIMPYLWKVKRADILAQSEYKRAEKLEELIVLEKLYEEIINRKDPVSLKELAVTGKDLMDMGIPHGKQIGEILTYLLELVLEEPKRNTKEYLLQKVKEKV